MRTLSRKRLVGLPTVGACAIPPPLTEENQVAKGRLTPAYSTPLGRAYNGDAAQILTQVADDSVVACLHLAAVRPAPAKSLRQRHRRRVYRMVHARSPRKSTASCGPTAASSWISAAPGTAGSGTRSLFPYELLIRLGKIFHLAQDFYWHNPSRLPTPAEWVTIRRTRVKEAVTHIWWLSKTTEPQADNRHVLMPYSEVDETAAQGRLSAGDEAVAA